MATGVEWLQKQKKADLSEIADTTGLKRYVANTLLSPSTFTTLYTTTFSR